jgi:hypothetical protein
MQSHPKILLTRHPQDHMPLNTFSLVQNNYTGIFDAAGAKRPSPIPAEVVKIIGGNSTGGAYLRSPQIWSDLYLQYIFNPSLTRPPYTPTYTLWQTAQTNTNSAVPIPAPMREPTDLHLGPIIGGTVGSILFVCLVATFLIVRHRRAITARRTADAAAIAREASVNQHNDSLYEDNKHPGMYRTLQSFPFVFPPGFSTRCLLKVISFVSSLLLSRTPITRIGFGHRRHA